MDIGLFAPLASPACDGAFLRELGQTAEELGFESLWVAEHVVLFDEYTSRYPYSPDGRMPGGGDGVLEPFTSLAFLAAATQRIRLGTGVCLVPQRNPVYTAKEAANVDWLSGGRLELGVGVGWLAEEFAAAGVPFAHRGARCRSYLEVMKRLWCDDVSEYSDAFYTLPACRQYPKPLQRPHPPIHFGGESDPALRRVAELGQGWLPFDLGPDELAQRTLRLKDLLAQRGRNLSDIRISVSPYLRPLQADWLPRYRDAGADRVIASVFVFERARIRPALEQLAERILEPARRI